MKKIISVLTIEDGRIKIAEESLEGISITRILTIYTNLSKIFLSLEDGTCISVAGYATQKLEYNGII